MKKFMDILTCIEQSGIRIIHFQSATILCPVNDNNPLLELPIIVLSFNPSNSVKLEKYDTLDDYVNKSNCSIRLIINKWPFVRRSYIVAAQLIRKNRIYWPIVRIKK